MRIVNISSLEQFTAVKLLDDPGAIGGPKVIPSCVEVEIILGLSDLQTGHMVLHGSYGGGFVPTSGIANSILTGLTTGANWTALAGFLATTAQIAGVLLRDLNVANQPLVPSNVGGALGTSASPAIPSEVALAVTHRTALAGKANRGRNFMAGWATNALGGSDTANPATVTALQNWAKGWAGILSGQGITFAIGHVARAAYTGSTGTEHPARPAGTVPITVTEVRDNHWDSQRRRGLK